MQLFSAKSRNINRESHESHESCSEKKKAGGKKGRRLREKREEGFSYGVLQEPRQPP
ncbi:hypothetical protein BIFPSEUDO_04285 [Bifidobacterium pseudocatenulatum DSM 20438 = JCM 1200 = LMG 10505]|uniref:Uncharacterized protein n=1 Tax=Bifidobacterium pseudocatenulatum DSM 20438 = JCM 1200 = LMG 10505 TaxID=547043 RepID=C0BV42_BIFPS|nr:hypothetical protein BIFPSEUDO_04285 [Bifidobacterium pseudocatenulatum DSM 20438 = JCM 1200 = LMG 10505]